MQLSIRKPDSGPGQEETTPQRGPETRFATAIKQLLSLGIAPRICQGRRGASAGGVAIKICAREWTNSPDLLADSLAGIRDALEFGSPLNITVANLGCGDTGIDSLRHICELLKTTCGHARLRIESIGLCVAAGDIALPAFQVISTAVVGHGPRFVAIGRAHMDGCKEVGDTEADWAALYARRTGSAPLWPIYDAGVRTRCPLLSSETSNALLPITATSVPAETAWLPVELDLCRFADANGRLHVEALSLAIDASVELGDELFGLLSWPATGQQADAKLNRRLAVTLTGLGDLVRLRKQDPADLECLRDLDGLVGFIHQRLWEKSRQLAEAHGPLPALERHHPAGRWPDEAHHQDWTRRWQQALETAQVRHRNLLVMSPYSILPRCPEAQKEFVDLLPLIAHADALSFAEPPRYDGWTIADFKVFHRRAWAITQRRNAASFVAAGV